MNRGVVPMFWLSFCHRYGHQQMKDRTDEIVAAASAAYYTALLLSSVQEPGQETYMDIAKALGYRGGGLLSFQLCP